MDLPAPISLREVRVDPLILAAAESVLSPDEVARRATFRSADRRQSFTMGRFAGRTLLAGRLGCSPSAVPLAVLADGSLAVEGSALHLSISHSGPYAAAAVSTGAVGLDLERIRPRPESLFRFVLHPDEFGLRDVVDLPPDRQLVLFWALKEAVLKARRTGLRQSPKALRLSVRLAEQRAIIRGAGDWDARFRIDTDRVLAVAWPRG